MDAVEPELVDQAEAALRQVPGVQDLESLRLRWIGHGIRAEVALIVNVEPSPTWWAALGVRYGGHRMSETSGRRTIA
jgi:divalent metal cation (Fe/Co/Zn/Cd) transporter